MKSMYLTLYNMKSILSKLSIAAISLIAISSCVKPEPVNPIDESKAIRDGAFILSQGNYYEGVEGSFNAIDFNSGKGYTDLFYNANGRHLGNTPTCGIATENYIVLGVEYSNTIEILDRKTYTVVKQIKLSDPSMGTEPISMELDAKYVYIAMYDGFLARLNLESLEIDKSIKVGANPEVCANPEQIAIHRGKIYVPNSEGMNWMEGRPYGTTASIVDIATFEVEKTITVPLNPYKFISLNNELYLIAKGDYGAIESMLYKINDDYSATPITTATHAAGRNNAIYVIYTPFKEGGVEINYKTYNTTTREIAPMKIETTGLDYPCGLGIDPTSGNIVIGYEVFNGTYPSYTLPGYAVRFDLNGKPSEKYPTGAGTACIFFCK